jgi:enoyl-CoA hydratase/carnithine racemase
MDQAEATPQMEETAGERQELTAEDLREAGLVAELVRPRVKPRAAIMNFFAEERREWTLSDMESEMRRREWLDPSLSKPTEAIRAAARRLADAEGLIRRVNKNTYAPLERSVDRQAEQRLVEVATY